jgi:hypothetical protein
VSGKGFVERPEHCQRDVSARFPDRKFCIKICASREDVSGDHDATHTEVHVEVSDDDETAVKIVPLGGIQRCLLPHRRLLAARPS